MVSMKWEVVLKERNTGQFHHHLQAMVAWTKWERRVQHVDLNHTTPEMRPLTPHPSSLFQQLDFRKEQKLYVYVAGRLTLGGGRDRSLREDEAEALDETD